MTALEMLLWVIVGVAFMAGALLLFGAWLLPALRSSSDYCSNLEEEAEARGQR